MSPRTGRPPKENTMDERIQVRASHEEIEKLDECAKLLKTTRSDIVRQGIELMYKKTKK